MEAEKMGTFANFVCALRAKLVNVPIFSASISQE